MENKIKEFKNIGDKRGLWVYLMTERLLVGCMNKKECDLWVESLKWTGIPADTAYKIGKKIWMGDYPPTFIK